MRAMGNRVRGTTYQSTSRPNTLKNRTNACLINATPPPCGVLLKYANLAFFSFNSVAYFMTAFQVPTPTVFLKSSMVAIWMW